MPRLAHAVTLVLVIGCGSKPSSQSQVDSLRAAVDSIRHAAADGQAVAQQRVADSVRRDAIQPRALVLFSDPVWIPAPGQVVAGVVSEGFVAFGFTLDRAGSCTLTGRLEVVDGGAGRDIQVLAMAHDDFVNWRNNGRQQALYESPPQTITTLNVPFQQAGTYYLVLSNRMSVVSSKRISGTPTVTCMGPPTPVTAK